MISLLCLPWAGASANAYLRWQRRLPAWIRVVPVELPGRGERLAEPFDEDFERVVSRLCTERAGAMHGRYALFGHSMGALLAYGIAQRGRSHRQSLPCAMFVSGSPAPARLSPIEVDESDDTALIEDLRRQGGTPPDVFGNADLLRMALDTLRADYRVCKSFVCGGVGPLPLPIHAFGGRRDDVSEEHLEAWREETGREFTTEWFDGGHFFIRDQESAALSVIERRLREQLSRSDSALTAGA